MSGEDLIELADRLWRGDVPIEKNNPFLHLGTLVEVAPRTAFVASAGNVSAFETDAGLVLVDTGSEPWAGKVHEALRLWSSAPVHTIIYSHGHPDHVWGIVLFDEEARTRGLPRPRLVAHEDVPRRFDRYLRTTGYNTTINQRQFQDPNIRWPVQYRYPDQTYRDTLTLEIGGERFELHHGRGETNDHTWIWAPVRKVLCSADFFIWAIPNAGNPQKVQRYAGDWAAALQEMSALDAEVLLPGHGLPVLGSDRIRQTLTETAELLTSLETQALALMNQGSRLDEIIHGVKAPEHLTRRPYLRPILDEPEFIVRNIWRLYGGWWDGNPATLKPASEADLAREIARLAGGPLRLAERARALAGAGDLRLAGHLAELAALAAPRDGHVWAIRADVFRQRAAAEQSSIAKGIFGSVATQTQGPPS